MSLAAGIVAIFFIALPWLVVGLAPQHRDAFVIVYDLVSETVMFCLAARAYSTSRGPIEKRHGLLLCVGVLALGIADFLFVGCLGRVPLPYQQLVGECCYTLAFLALATLLSRHLRQACQPGVSSVIMALFAGVSMLLQWHFILGPLDQSAPPFPPSIRLNYYIYSVATAWAFGAAAVISLRASCSAHFGFVQALLLCLASDYALRFHAAINQYASSSEATAGWTSGVGAMAIWAMLAARRGHNLWLEPLPLVPWRSLRCLVGSLTFLSSTALVLGAIPAGLVSVENGFELSLLLGLILVGWIVANTLAIGISTKLQSAVDLMPAPAALAAAQNPTRMKLPLVQARTGVYETDALIHRYNALAQAADLLADATLKAERDMAVAAMARQVSHDIRSPLAALSVLLPELEKIKEEHRVLARSAVHRVHDIANTLLAAVQDTRVPAAVPGTELANNEPILMSALLDSIISEKRVEYRDRLSMSIDLRIDRSSYGAFVSICVTELKRAISNLINNAVEALPEQGGVLVTLAAESGTVLTTIADTGKGIPAGFLAMIGQCGRTFGKTEGNGLGLPHAMQLADCAGGDLSIESEVGLGTTVRLELPQATAPSWFMPALRLEDISNVVILDDDQSIHNIWRERFNTPKIHALKLTHLQNSRQFRAFVADQDTARTLFLVDHDLRGSKDNGLELVSEMGLVERSALVTSRYDEPELISRCNQLRVKIIPKPVASAVPIVC